MPSPSQDSETLTDAELAEYRALAEPDEAPSGAVEMVAITKPDLRSLISEVSRHRTPSVPGEGFVEQARAWLLTKGYALTLAPGFDTEACAQSLATELSSTAALAREEERERCRQIAEKYANNPLGGDVQDTAEAHANGLTYTSGGSDTASAIARAIGKDG